MCYPCNCAAYRGYSTFGGGYGGYGTYGGLYGSTYPIGLGASTIVTPTIVSGLCPYCGFSAGMCTCGGYGTRYYF